MKNLVWLPLLVLAWLATGATLRSPKDQPSSRARVVAPSLPPLPSVVVIPAAPSLSWDAPTNGVVTDYLLLQGPSSQTYTNFYRIPGDATNYVLLALTNGVMQFYRLDAFTTNAGTFSNELMVNGPDTNMINVVWYWESYTNKTGAPVWQSEFDLPLRFSRSNQPAFKQFRVHGTIQWN